MTYNGVSFRFLDILHSTVSKMNDLQNMHYRIMDVESVCLSSSVCHPLYPGPALGMFEVFGRTGPQNLGGPQIWTPQKINLPF